MAITRIHHINFVVRDLDAAIERFEASPGLGPFERIDHEARGSTIAFAPVGESWFVLVCPHDEDSAPGRHLEAHGEGLFLLSFGTDDISDVIERAGKDPDVQLRHGILDWEIADIGTWCDAVFQVTRDE